MNAIWVSLQGFEIPSGTTFHLPAALNNPVRWSPAFKPPPEGAVQNALKLPCLWGSLEVCLVGHDWEGTEIAMSVLLYEFKDVKLLKLNKCFGLTGNSNLK